MEGNLTASEQRLITAALLSHTEEFNNIKFDYAKIAEKAGFKTNESARVNFGKAKRRLLELAEDVGPMPKLTSPEKGSPNKVVKKTKAGTSPTKGKGAGAKKSAKKVKDEDAEDESNSNDGENGNELKAEPKSEDDA